MISVSKMEGRKILLTKDPNEKHTAEPPIITMVVDSAESVVCPISNGLLVGDGSSLGVIVERVSVLRENEHISSDEISKESFMTPPTRYVSPLQLTTLAPNRDKTFLPCDSFERREVWKRSFGC